MNVLSFLHQRWLPKATSGVALGPSRDLRQFFSLPITNAVWSKTKLLQNQDFAAFIESALKD
jgi:hypothetical protein